MRYAFAVLLLASAAGCAPSTQAAYDLCRAAADCAGLPCEPHPLQPAERQCLPACQAASDCPAGGPESGARPVCWRGRCALECDAVASAGLACPSGQRCRRYPQLGFEPASFGQCVWAAAD